MEMLKDVLKTYANEHLVNNGIRLCSKCEIKEGDSCWGPIVYYDDENGDVVVLVLAESPSGDKKNDGCIDVINDIGTQKEACEFVKSFFNANKVVFTDIFKCGFFDTAKTKKRINDRFNNCKSFLREEIEIINPAIVLCIGIISYNKVSDDYEYLFQGKQPNVFYLTHYSKLANLQLKIEDKEKFIWNAEIEYQLGNDANIDLNDLEYYKKIKKIEQTKNI